MTKEQEEAIKNLAKLVNLRKRKNKIEHDTCICSTRDLDIVLDMLEEKDKEIEFLKEELEKKREENMENIEKIMKKERLKFLTN